MRRTLLAFAIAALCATSALVTAQDQAQQSFPGFDPGGTTRTWLKDAGASWKIEWSHARGTPELLYGGNRPMLPASATASDAALEQAARGVVDGLATALGFTSETLQLSRVRRLDHLVQAGTSAKIVVSFRQVTEGVRTWNGSVNVLFSRDGRLLAVDNSALPHAAQIPLVPENSEAAALQLAREAFAAETGFSAASWTRDDYVLFPARLAAGKDAVRGVPAFVFALDAGLVGSALPVKRQYFVAATGELRVLDSRNLIYQADLSGNVSGWGQVGLLPDGVENESLHGMKDVRLTGTGIPTTFTDLSGNFVIPGIAAPVSVTAALQGQWSRVNNDAGAESTLLVSVAPGVPATFTFNPSKSEMATAEVNAHYFTEKQRDWIKSLDPSENVVDFQRVENVNINQQCNAIYDGSSTNYYLNGGGCVNSAYASVVRHENGHWLNELFDSIPSAGFHEGGADLWAMYEADDPVIGPQFSGPGTYIRTGLNTTPFCGDSNPGCYGEEHTDGEPLMGAVWKVRAALKSTLGTVPGGSVADHLLLAWFQVYNDGQINSIIEKHWLTLDDNNGNIDDGTPHYADINSGFMAQGFPGYFPPVFSITHTPLTIVNSEAAVPVVANVVPLNGATVGSVTAFWTTDTGFSPIWHPVAMAAQGGNNWLGFLPGQTSPKVVRYYVEAKTPGNAIATVPAGAPGANYLYDVGTLATQLAYDFEPISDEGWTHAQVAVQDDWQHGAPAGKSTDPAFAWSGTRCWGNDLGLTVGTQQFNGEYQPDVNNYLQSPSFNFTGKTNLRLRFMRWLGVEDGFYDQATITVNGTQIFQNEATPGGTKHTLDQAWTPQDFDIGAFANNNASVQIRFRLDSDAGLNFGGWNIDDVRVVSLGPVQPTAFVEYGTGTPGFGGQAPHLAGSGNGTPGGAITLNLSNARPSTVGALFSGGAQAALPFKGGTFLVAPPFVQLALGTSPAGTASVGGNIPADPALYGLTVYMQYWCNDAAAVKGKAGSNGLKFLVN
jgi:hypothetical protein